MGKRKMAREANRETEVKTKKMKFVNAETDIANHGDHLSRDTNPRKLKCESNADTKVESFSKESKGKKSIKGNKALMESEKKTEVSKETKSKKTIFVDDELHEIEVNKSDVELTNKKSRKRNKTAHDPQVNNVVNNSVEEVKVEKPKELIKKKTLSKGESKSKKIVFVDDEPQEVPSMSGTITKPANAKKKFLNDDEAEVKEEDIDKFCDELNEEDNAQYEEWVKLIEANFHSNKKKVK